jgi:hypothetical protein
MLDQEREYFSAHADDLRRQHPDKFVVIKGSTVAGAFNTHEEALAFGAREFGLNPFLIRNVNQPNDQEINVPALTLGILRLADPSHTVRR